MYSRTAGVSELEFHTLSEIRKDISDYGEDKLIFVSENGEEWEMYYVPDCCASCNLEDICGDLDDLVGNPITTAEEVSSYGFEEKIVVGEGPVPQGCESWTWTFYKLSTIKGSVTLRWLGTSNGYYSESVSFFKTKDKNDRTICRPRS